MGNWNVVQATWRSGSGSVSGNSTDQELRDRAQLCRGTFVAGAADLSHPSRAQRRKNLVWPKFAGCGETHLFFSSAFQSTNKVIAVLASPLSSTMRNRWPSAVTSNLSNVYEE